MKRIRVETLPHCVYTEANTAKWKMEAGCMIVMKKSKNNFIELVTREFKVNFRLN